jgi:hypothetical protein
LYLARNFARDRKKWQRLINEYLTRDYYDRDKVAGFGNSAIFFLVFIFTSHIPKLIPPTQLLVFQRGMGSHILIVVTYLLVKTIGAINEFNLCY